MAIVIVRTLIIYIALVLSMRFMGKRQLGQLELSELIVAVLIADLGSHPLQDIGIPLMNGLLPIIVLFCCEILISGGAMRSAKLRQILYGKPCFLITRGRIDRKAMRDNRLTVDELASELRGKGITDISTVEYAVLETDGLLNTVLYPEYRPLNPKLAGISPEDPGYPVTVINDGRLMADNLKKLGLEKNWLLKELERRGAKSHKEVYLMTVDGAGTVYYSPKEG